MTQRFQSPYPKLSLIMVMSANGVVAQKEVQNSFEWNSVEDREQFLKRVSEIGTVLMGSNTYRSIGSRPYAGIDFYVMSHHPHQFVSHERVHFVQGSIKQVLVALKQSGIDHVALLGGPKTNAQCFEERLISDIFVTIEPLMMPEGMRLTTNLSNHVKLALQSILELNQTKTLLLHYQVIE